MNIQKVFKYKSLVYRVAFLGGVELVCNEKGQSADGNVVLLNQQETATSAREGNLLYSLNSRKGKWIGPCRPSETWPFKYSQRNTLAESLCRLSEFVIPFVTAIQYSNPLI